MGIEENRVYSTIDSIRILLKRGMKSHYVYDVNKLVTHVYEAQTDAEHGDACLLTRYSYVTGTSDVENSVEELSSWDSSWDI